MRRYKENTATVIWQHYEKGVDHHRKMNLYSDTETFYNMVEAEQWRGIESGNEKLPFHDFISGVVEHKTAMVAMNLMTINYSPMNTGPDQAMYRDACELLNQYASSKWELTKMDTTDWDMVHAACVTGDSYLFFYNSNLDHQIIDRTNIYFADEQERDIQKQKRVIIYERRMVDDVKEEAKANGIDEQEITQIVADDDTDTLPDVAKQEVENDKKCSCLLCIEKKSDGIYISRSTQSVIYQPEERIDGLTLIPIAKMVWFPKRGSSRGIGEVKRLLSNQIQSNKLLYRRQESIKMSAFPKPVANIEMITNPDDASKVGVMMKIKGITSKISDAFTYVSPQPATHEPKQLQDEFIQLSKDLANAGDNATGNINPERASGAAIIAVRDQQAIATTKQQAYHKQFIEDVAAIWLDTWIAYNPNGLEIPLEEDTDEGTQLAIQQIPAEVLQNLQAQIRIDVSPTNPYSKYANQQQIDNLVNLPWFEDSARLQEYHDLLDDDSPIKGKLKDLLEDRKAILEEQAMMQEQSESQRLTGQLEQAMGMIEQQNQIITQYEGGMPNDVSIMQDGNLY